MVCWLKFLQKVSDILKDVEPNLYKRKEFSIEILKELEKEKGHNVVAIGKAIDVEGKAGIIRRFEKKKRRKIQDEFEEEEKEEAEALIY